MLKRKKFLNLLASTFIMIFILGSEKIFASHAEDEDALNERRIAVPVPTDDDIARRIIEEAEREFERIAGAMCEITENAHAQLIQIAASVCQYQSHIEEEQVFSHSLDQTRGIQSESVRHGVEIAITQFRDGGRELAGRLKEDISQATMAILDINIPQETVEVQRLSEEVRRVEARNRELQLQLFNELEKARKQREQLKRDLRKAQVENLRLKEELREEPALEDYVDAESGDDEEER